MSNKQETVAYLMKSTLVVTILNEESSLPSFLLSLKNQTVKPSEVIIVDGGSTDKSIQIIKDFSKSIRIFTKRGNRSVGRNYAIEKAHHEIILITDAGCVLDTHWVERISEPFNNKSTDVVAGYYKAKATTVFQKCLVPYVLVMPSRVDPKKFLPASRSMALRKHIWKKIGKFPEEFSHNEDYVFAQELKKRNVNIFFQKNAFVYWIPRKTISESYVMFFRFAFGDGEAGILRPKVLFLLLRYIVAFTLLFLGLIVSIHYLYILFILGMTYLVWTILKNYRYIRHFSAFYYLPLIQLTADIAVISGTIAGFTKKK